MDRLTRTQVIDLLRQELTKMTDDENSMCMVAAEKGIFCRGFARLSSTELRERFQWLEENAHRRLTVPELRARANTWQLARQVVHDVNLACDAESEDRDHCAGWDGFDNGQLAKFHQELLGTEVEVVEDAPPSTTPDDES